VQKAARGAVRRGDSSNRIRTRLRRAGRGVRRRQLPRVGVLSAWVQSSAVTAERAAVISGAGRSVIGRRLGIPDLTLTVDAALRAIADAGLEPADIDGLATYTGELPGPRPGGFFGYSGSPTRDVVDALRLQLNWWSAGHEGPSQLVSLFHAILAVSAGLARHVLVYRTQTETSFAAAARSGGEPPPHPSAWFW